MVAAKAGDSVWKTAVVWGAMMAATKASQWVGSKGEMRVALRVWRLVEWLVCSKADLKGENWAAQMVSPRVGLTAVSMVSNSADRKVLTRAVSLASH